MKEKWRYNVRLAARKGVSIGRGEGPTDLDTFYRLYQQTSERDRFFIHSRDHYHAIMQLYSEGDRAALSPAERDRELNERLDHLGRVAGVCQESGMWAACQPCWLCADCCNTL